MFFQSIRHDPSEKNNEEGGWQKTSLPHSDCCSQTFSYAAVHLDCTCSVVVELVSGANWIYLYCNSAWWPIRLHAILCQRLFWNQWRHGIGSGDAGGHFTHDFKPEDLFCGASFGSETSQFSSNYLFTFGFKISFEWRSSGSKEHCEETKIVDSVLFSVFICSNVMMQHYPRPLAPAWAELYFRIDSE